jgi:hypothetical protein
MPPTLGGRTGFAIADNMSAADYRAATASIRLRTPVNAVRFDACGHDQAEYACAGRTTEGVQNVCASGESLDCE